MANENNTKSLKKPRVSYVLFILSFLPYLLTIYFAIVGIGGWPIGTSYGIEAMIWTVISFSIIPIYPALLIFQAIYVMKKYKAFNLSQKRVAKLLVCVFVILIIIPFLIQCATDIFSNIEAQKQVNQLYTYEKPFIENYLKDYFGEEHYKGMEILKPSRPSTTFYIRTPLLNNETFYIELNDMYSLQPEIIENTFCFYLRRQEKTKSQINAYLSLYKLPSNMDAYVYLYDVDVKSFPTNDIEDLLSLCKLSCTFNVSVSRFDKSEIIQMIKEFWKENANVLKKYNASYNFCLRFDENIMAHIDVSQEDSQTLKIIFRVEPHYSSIVNIEDFDIEILLDN